MPGLSETFQEHWSSQVGIAPNMLLGAYVPTIQIVLDFVDNNPAAKKIKEDIQRIFHVSNWLLDSKQLQAFTQLVGEAQFWKMAKDRGVDLIRVPERSNEKTPDFRLAGAEAGAPCFEVKTLSVVNGEFNLKAMAEDSYQAQLSLSSQVAQGRRVATAITSTSPHGVVDGNKSMTTIIRNLIDKANNNIKVGQYAEAPTCLVLNLLMVDGYYNGRSSLRPVAFGYPQEWNLRSGAYWNLAFGEPGNLVFGLAEFEGKPSVEGVLDRQGILKAHPEIRALLLIVHPLTSDPLIYGLAREKDTDQWLDEHKALGDAFLQLVGENWNDEGDTLGWRLTEH